MLVSLTAVIGLSSTEIEADFVIGVSDFIWLDVDFIGLESDFIGSDVVGVELWTGAVTRGSSGDASEGVRFGRSFSCHC